MYIIYYQNWINSLTLLILQFIGLKGYMNKKQTEINKNK